MFKSAVYQVKNMKWIEPKKILKYFLSIVVVVITLFSISIIVDSLISILFKLF